ncbi:MAG: biopolymer transporter ExbD [Candidatus Omnitrophica bacterium]|nr:biopolymer transporter ExbD [Candidatus Omnitrophota bacterium]
MKFKKRLTPESGIKQLEITPLLDCIFLLLIFFMLTSNFIVVPGINVKLPKAVSSDAVNTRTATIVVSSENIIYLDGEPISRKELEEYLKAGNTESVFIKSDRDTSMGTVVEIWDICKRLGIEKIGIATTYGD